MRGRRWVAPTVPRCASGVPKVASGVATMKSQVYADYEKPLDAALADANRLMVDSLQADDFREGVASFLERRGPDFAPLGGRVTA